MHFERQDAFQNAIKLISFQKKVKKICVPTLPKIFRPVTRNTLFLFGVICPFIPVLVDSDIPSMCHVFNCSCSTV